MRKRINILFVALATTSVVYGMVLRYSHESPMLRGQESALSAEEVVNFEDDIKDLDVISASNPD